MGYFTSLYAEDLPHRAVSVYMYLKDRADKDGKCYPAIGTNQYPRPRFRKHRKPADHPVQVRHAARLDGNKGIRR